MMKKLHEIDFLQFEVNGKQYRLSSIMKRENNGITYSIKDLQNNTFTDVSKEALQLRLSKVKFKKIDCNL